jgi:hypothetical protein
MATTTIRPLILTTMHYDAAMIARLLRDYNLWDGRVAGFRIEEYDYKRLASADDVKAINSDFLGIVMDDPESDEIVHHLYNYATFKDIILL